MSTAFQDTRSESSRVTSNGFEGNRVDTIFFCSAGVSVKDPDGRRPEEFDYAGARLVDEIPADAGIGRGACERATTRTASRASGPAAASAPNPWPR